MFSLQNNKTSSTEITQEALLWKTWKHDHPEFQRESATRISYDGDKLLLLGGYVAEGGPRIFNLILIDIENEKFQVIPYVGDDFESCSWGDMSACYWKDSRIIVSGGYDYENENYCSTVALITLKDLDSENPSAHWEKIITPTEFSRKHHSSIIYQDKMYVFGGDYEWEERERTKNNFWCLDLTDFTWHHCYFAGYTPESDKAKQISIKNFYLEEDVDLKFILGENKVYAVQKGHLANIEAIREFDLETMSFKSHTIPKSPTDNSLNFDPSPQVINGKIYFLGHRAQRDNVPRLVLAFDLDSRNWIEIKAESYPNLNKLGFTLCCKNHLIFHAVFDNPNLVFGEFWALPLNALKPSKYSSTSTTVNKVQQTMKEFFFEAPYSDVSFEVESQVIPAHKWLLTQRNKFFANLFSSGSASKISITDLKGPTFRALLEYLYSDHVEIDDIIALELLQQANKYSIEGELKNTCEKHLIKNIGPDNYVAFGKLAESIEATSLRDAVVSFIARNMKKIKPRKDFDEISDALLRDSIIKFIVK